MWDARFRVARGAAALELPAEPVLATLLLSGPAELTVRAGGATTTHEVAASPTPIDVPLPEGGRAELSAAGPVRLHEVVLRRTGGVPWARLGLVLAVAIGAALLVHRRPRPPAVAGVTLAVIAVAGLALRGRLGGVVALGLLDRAGPAISAVAGDFQVGS